MLQTLFVVKRLSRRIKAEILKLKRLEDLKFKTSQELDGMPKSHGGDNLIERLIAEICDKEKLVNDLKIIRAQCRIELNKLFEKYFGAEHLYFELQTMTYRYSYDFSFSKIAERINYSLQSVYRFHINALSILGLKLSDIQATETQFVLLNDVESC